MAKEISQRVKGKEYKEIWGKTLINMVAVIIIGTGLNAAGMELKFAVNHMPLILFWGTILVTTGIQIIECFRFYKNYGEVIKRTNVVFIGIIECIVLLLAIMGRLEVVEMVAAIIGCTTIKTITIFIDNRACTEETAEMNINSQGGDAPIVKEEDLFKSRGRQLDNLCKELSEFNGEPFAVAISGKWGAGKTSFVNVLKEKLKQAEFVNVECSLEYDAKSVLKDISSQIQEIYRRNNVYTGKNGVIENYFEKIGEFIGTAGYDGFSRIISKFQIKDDGSYWDNKNAMNKELDTFYRLTKKRIFFLVDDMDRIIDEKMRAVLFQVIRESVGLNHCITLFMVDYDKLASECMSKEFLEKYVNHQIELCDIEFEEIISKYEQTFFVNSFWIDKSDYIREKGKVSVKNLIIDNSRILCDIQSKIQQLKGIFSPNVLEDANILMKSLTELEKYILNNPENIDSGDMFMELLIDIERKDKSDVSYLGDNRKNVINALCDIYSLLQRNSQIEQSFGDRWKFCKIRLFRMKRDLDVQ